MKNKMIKNKKATDKIISIYWFVILFIVAASIVYMVSIFYGEPYDIREVEVNILANQIADCLASAGYLKESVWDNGNLLLNNDNFLQKCNLNFNVEDFKTWDNNQYWVNVSFYKFESQDNSFFDIYQGNKNLKDYCNQESKNFPVCVERSFYVLGKIMDSDKDEKYMIKILSVVRKTEKNVQ